MHKTEDGYTCANWYHANLSMSMSMSFGLISDIQVCIKVQMHPVCVYQHVLGMNPADKWLPIRLICLVTTFPATSPHLQHTYAVLPASSLANPPMHDAISPINRVRNLSRVTATLLVKTQLLLLLSTLGKKGKIKEAKRTEYGVHNIIKFRYQPKLHQPKSQETPPLSCLFSTGLLIFCSASRLNEMTGSGDGTGQFGRDSRT
jgi:hypothetical protein